MTHMALSLPSVVVGLEHCQDPSPSAEYVYTTTILLP